MILENKIRRTRGLLAVASAFIAGGTVLYSTRRELVDFWPFSYEVYMFTVGLLVLSGTSILALLYLRGEIDLPFLSKVERNDKPSLESGAVHGQPGHLGTALDSLQKRLNAVEKNLDSRRGQVEISLKDRLQILEGVREQLPAKVADELRKEFHEEALNTAPGKVIRTFFDASIYRLRREIFDLSRRANINLVIGGFTTIAAIGILVIFVLAEAPETTDLPGFVGHYVPRLSVAIFVEVFSFFFLRLYKASLQEIRYYQNEITRLTLLRIALVASRHNGESALLSKAIEAMAGSVPVAEIHERKNKVELDADALSNLLERAAQLVSKATTESKS